MSLTANVYAGAQVLQAGAPSLGSANAKLAVDALISFTSGTGVGKADLAFVARRTIAAGGADNLDLSGVLTDAFGAVINAVKVKAIVVKAAADNSAALVVGNGASPFQGPLGASASTVSVAPSGVYAVADLTGWAVTAGTGDILKVSNPGASAATYDIAVLGASA